MENTEAEKKKNNKWFAGYLVAGLIYAIAQQSNFTKTSVGELIVGIVAIFAGIFYHRLKEKIKIRNATVRIVVTFLILEMIAGGLIGFSTSFINLYSTRISNSKTEDLGWGETTRAMFMKESIDSCEKGNEKFCTCVANYLMGKYSYTEIHEMARSIRESNSTPQGITDASSYCQTSIN